MRSRRAGLVGAVALLLASGCVSARPVAADRSCAAGNGSGARVLLLGTAGGPRIRAERSQPATAIVVDGKVYLFDVGYGTLARLAEAGIALDAVAAVFITHNHFDHTADLPALLAFSWHAGRTAPLPIYGPPGTLAVARQALAAFAHGIEIFNSETPRPAPLLGHDYIIHEVEPQAVVQADRVVAVRSAENTHYRHLQVGSPAKGRDRSYSYRVDMPEGAIVITGDTGTSDELVKLADGADVLVSEVLDEQAIRQYMEAWARRDRLSADTAKQALTHMLDGHLSADEVADLANRAKVKKVVLTHLVPSASGDIDALAATIRARFPGEVVAGKDLLAIPLACRGLAP